MSLTEKITDLSPNDIKLLKNQSSNILKIVFVFVILAFAVSICSVLFSQTYCVFVAVAVIIVVPLIIFVLITRVFTSDDLKKAYKIVYSGQISDKIIRTYQNQSGAYTDDINETRTQSYMYFLIDQIEFLVSEEYFDKFQKGDTVEIHQTASGIFMYALPLEN